MRPGCIRREARKNEEDTVIVGVSAEGLALHGSYWVVLVAAYVIAT